MHFIFTADWNFIRTVDHLYLYEEDHTNVYFDKCDLLCVSGKISAGVRMQIKAKKKIP